MLLHQFQAENFELLFIGQVVLPRMNSTLFFALNTIITYLLHEW